MQLRGSGTLPGATTCKPVSRGASQLRIPRGAATREPSTLLPIYQKCGNDADPSGVLRPLLALNSLQARVQRPVVPAARGVKLASPRHEAEPLRPLLRIIYVNLSHGTSGTNMALYRRCSDSCEH